METNGSFYIDGGTYTETNDGLGNVPVTDLTPNGAESSFYQNGQDYTEADHALATTQATDAAASAAAALASQVAAAASAAAALVSEGNSDTSEAAALASQSAAAASAAAALVSEGNADTSEAGALASAGTATTQAGIATTQAGIATTQAGNASTSASAALTSEGNADTSEAASAASAAAAAASAAATAAALSGYAPLASPALTGTPTAPTAAPATNTTQLATTAFVLANGTTLSSSTPLANGVAAVGTEAAASHGDHVHPTDTTRAPLASPTFTGVPAGPTAAAATNTTQLATTAFVEAARVILEAADALKAPLASPALTGTPTAPTAAPATNTTQLATTAFVLANAPSGSSTPNLCTNPGMQVWQNATTLAAMTHRTVLADGWLYGHGAGTSVWTGTRETTTLPDTTVAAKIKVQCTTAEASPAAAVDRHIRWAVHGRDFAPWASTDMKVKFYVRAKKTGVYSVAAINEARDRTYLVEYTVSAADTWELQEVTIPFSTKTGTWNTGDGYGFGLRWALVAGTTYRAAAGAWQTGNYVGSTNLVNAGDSTANYFEITKVQVCPTNCPTFSLPSYDQALQSAYRQYRVLTTTSAGGVNFVMGGAATADTVNFEWVLSPTMMAPPTVALQGTYATDWYVSTLPGTIITATVAISAYARSNDFAKISADKAGGFTAGSMYLLRLHTTSGKLVIDGHLA